jgi:hypothetical protein
MRSVLLLNLCVRLAGLPQTMQMACTFVTCSAIAIKYGIG